MIKFNKYIRLFTFLFFLYNALISNAQTINLGENFYAGGNFWIRLGNPSEVYIAPLVGYKLTNTLSSGMSFFYRYRGMKSTGVDISLHDYGSGVFLRNYFFDNFFGQAEYEYQNYATAFLSSSSAETVIYKRHSLHSALLGAGVSYPLGKATMSVMALYNLSFDENGPYDSPIIIRGGLSLGL